MENRLAKMEQRKNSTDFKLLPAYCKGIGFLILLLSGAAVLLIRIKDFGLTPEQYARFLDFVLHGAIISLLLIATSRDKAEDEQTQAIRVKSMATVFVINGVIVAMRPFLELLFQDTTPPFTAANLMAEGLVFYLILFNFQKLMR